MINRRKNEVLPHDDRKKKKDNSSSGRMRDD